ncbi:sterol-sensing domain of SREBP cleavage-activation-domain-containing protein [Lipomyces kononenkoae]|uniref:Sterol-sensing domain of SREBP cleavage-activation-domain-containing protein n=1 Tax=Lipomyces kononenkoae TaxID=34357 RepID=A0ACC3STI1_LIPKO
MLRTAVLALSRGSKYANDLTPAHELFRLYQRYAVRVVRSPQSFIIWSAITALALAYPLLYAVARSALSGSSEFFLPSTSSLSCAPTAESFIKDLSGVTADIAVKQAFVRGSNDAALERDVLDLAWKVQERLTDGIPVSECVLLSPAGFWGNAIEKFKVDDDPLSTINYHAVLDGDNQLGGEYIPPQSVLTGARFDDGRLVSCDALVISLFYRPVSSNLSVSEVWDRNVQELQVATHTGARPLYEVENSSSRKSRLEYLHRLSPLSHRGNTILMASYFLAVFYIVSSLQRMHALRSRIGLFIAFSVEMALSMIGASTIIYFTHLDLSMIPKRAFPFIVIVLGTENMFRLLNALSYTKPEQPAIVRIGTALGKVGFLSTVTTACNICVFLFAIFISGPPIRQVCTFAIVATIIDYILHMTYFVAVLSIDVRRLELEDLIQTSLGAASNDTDDSDEEELITNDTISWNPFPKIFSYFWDGSVPTTTTAGIATTGCFLAAMQLHYMRDTDFFSSLLEHVPWPVHPFATMTSMVNSTLLSRTSSNQSNCYNWFRVNDFLVSENVLATLAPGRNSFAIQFFEPVYFTLTSSTRSDGRTHLSFPSAGYVAQFIIVITLALVSTVLLLRHMLRDVRDEHVVDPRFNAGPVFVTKDLSGSHSLDVIKLATSANGIVASVGLDHRILLWQVNARRRQKPTKVSLSAESWPVTSIALDQDGKYLAICGKDGNVHCWNIVTSRFVWSVELAGLVSASPATLLFLTEKVPGMVTRVSLVIVGRNGMLYQIATDSGGVVFEHKISDIPLVSAEKLFTPRLPKRIVSATKEGAVIITTLVRMTWITEPLELRPGLVVAMTQQNMEPMINAPSLAQMPYTQAYSNDSTTIIGLPQIGMVLRARGILVDLIDVQTGTIVKVFQIATYKRGTLRAFHDHPQHCPFCGCSTVASICILYCERESGMFMMHSYINSNRARRNICLRVERDLRERRCIGFEGVLERQHWLDNVSGWEVTDINVVMGIRRKSDFMVVDNPIGDGSRGLRYRGANGVAGSGASYVYDMHGDTVEEQWEGWTMSMDGTVGTYELRPEEDFRQPRSMTRQLAQSSSDDGYDADINSTPSTGRRKRRQHNNYNSRPHRVEQDLLVSNIGPVARLGHRSTVVGFGNTVKVLYFGSEEIISPNDEEDEEVGLAYVSSRRRRAARRSESQGSVNSVGRESPPTSPSGVGGMMRGGLMSRGGGLMGGQARRGGLMRGGAGRY